jgi:hypothetical protein
MDISKRFVFLILVLVSGPSALAQTSDNNSLFREIAQENYSANKGTGIYSATGAGISCEVHVDGLPGSFRVRSYVDYLADFGGPLPGTRYYFLDAVVSEGFMRWTSWDGKQVELAFDPVTFKIKHFYDERIGCELR